MIFKAAFKTLLSLVALSAISLGITTTARAEPINLVGLGDSLMAGYQLPPDEAFPARLEKRLREKGFDVTIANAGVSGDTTADGLARLDWSIPDGTDGVILELGANDALRGLPPAETRKNLDAILARLKERDIPVVMMGMLAPPNLGQEFAAAFNPIFPELAKKYNVALYPFVLDGVALNSALQLEDRMHPNAKGTEVMADKFLAIGEAFLKSLGS
ncbi:acyl-CoA thioesterase-1 [Rhizobium sp. SG_E_25_P2]|uniref:arylesterase n=1 Tax=Rhizobium sp. SG_E_25_P2 TaxID=2879942 RepID=UPI002473D200|nr:arylesterase [Rhizobium sp. SG_E_25_P2]MDH6267614.1 acyl-CoA thioesterase-1 [Rhizobium sp. SG_E_25_P2]